MKETLGIIITCCLFCVFRAEAQLQKGTNYLGGTLSLNGTNSSSPRLRSDFKGINNSFSLSPAIQWGRFIRNRQLIGLKVSIPLSVYWGKSEQFNVSFYRYRSADIAYTLSPYWRGYKTLSDKWAVFTTASLDLAYLRYVRKDPSMNSTQNGYAVSVGVVPGVCYWITPRFAVESDIDLLSLGAGYKKMMDSETVFFKSAIQTSVAGYFSVRASWYLSHR